jgi:SAM-dependent methyltransferase
MPGNWGYLGEDVKKYLVQNFSPDCSILDVGCGHGFYYKLLKNHFKKFDAVEIWKPYIEKYGLEQMYDNVYNVNILDFQFKYYDIIIMGDILEHLDRYQAQSLLNNIKDKCTELIVVVPYYLPQQEVFGNKYEIHLQPDLNDKIMQEYYPMLELIKLENKELKIPIDMGTHYYYYCAFKKSHNFRN